MSENTEKIGAEHNNDANGGGVRHRKRIFVTVAILNGLALGVFFIGLQAYGYRVKTAVRASAFKTIGPLPDTGSNPLFDPQATLNGDNRIITVSGMYGCLPAEGDAIVNAIVSQESTGAFARGTFQGSCTGQVEHFTIRGSVPEGSPAFQEGRVKIEALGVNRRGTAEFTFTDLFFWGRFALASKSSDETSATPRSR